MLLLIYTKVLMSNFHPNMGLCFFSASESYSNIVENTIFHKTFLCPWLSSYIGLWSSQILAGFSMFSSTFPTTLSCLTLALPH